MRMADESEATETLRFGLDGMEYEVVLPRSHATDLRIKLAPYLDRARRVRPRMTAM
jgi:hypothetical protein